MPNLNLKKILLQNKNKKLFFLVAMPRSGNTLFASIMNQNPNVAVTANSVTNEICKEIEPIIRSETFKNFPYKKPYDNVCRNILPNYYQDWKQQFILDRGPWAFPNNLNFFITIFCSVIINIAHGNYIF